jgi:hypothetical protein
VERLDAGVRSDHIARSRALLWGANIPLLEEAARDVVRVCIASCWPGAA